MINYVNTSRQFAMLQYEQPNILSVTRGTVGQLSPETILSRTKNSMLSSFFTNKIHIATENFNKQKHTGLYILPIRLAYVISKMANFYVCCDKQQ